MNPQTGSFATIQIGSDADPFTAYQIADAPHIVRGGQGATMMGIRLRINASSVPPCLTQVTAYEDGAQGMNSSPIKTYQESDGSYTTKPLWIPGYFPATFTVRVDAGGITQRVRLGTPLDM
jgi:hypothetical protein